jgi:hypothetical protein
VNLLIPIFVMRCCVYNVTLFAISVPLMPDPQRPTGLSDAGQYDTASAIARRDPARAHDRGFGLALLLLSALSMVTGVAVALLFDWRGGAAMFIVATLVLSLFLRCEMRRRTRHRRAVLATQPRADLITTDTSPL